MTVIDAVFHSVISLNIVHSFSDVVETRGGNETSCVAEEPRAFGLKRFSNHEPAHNCHNS